MEHVFTGAVRARGFVFYFYMLVHSRRPARLSGAGESGVQRWTKKHPHPQGPSDLVVAIFDALAEQSAIVPGAEASVVARHVIPVEVLKTECKEIGAEAREIADSLLLLRV